MKMILGWIMVGLAALMMGIVYMLGFLNGRDTLREELQLHAARRAVTELPLKHESGPEDLIPLLQTNKTNGR